jgi:hypothetical protein
MGNATTTDVKKLLELAERMGIPSNEAMQQVRELRTEPEPAERFDLQHPEAPSGAGRRS